MKIAFVNPEPHDYHVLTPFKKPLGGSESAQIYLAIELAKLSHDIHLYTQTSFPGVYHQIHNAHFSDFHPQIESFDVIVVTSSPAYTLKLLKNSKIQCPIMAWEHNLWIPHQDHGDALKQIVQIENGYIICVSDWHKDHFIQNGNLNPDKIIVSKNAISPCFENLLPGSGDIFGEKSNPPVLSFTSTPYKGLAPAVQIFKVLHQQIPEIQLNVFSSFDLYAPNNIHRKEKIWTDLYKDCKNTPGINYHGNTYQKDLADHLKKSAMLFYPNILFETSSIAVMEAMAAGCIILTSSFGALPQTLAGFGIMVGNPKDNKIDGLSYIKTASELLDKFQDGDDELHSEIKNQVRFVNENYIWLVRAKEFEKKIKKR